jgi:predicted MFS family arabinose efflux permease
VLLIAAALALGPTVSLGLARFSYALLLPPMRLDLGWSYLTAGAMNTVNAAGYLAGAVMLPRLLKRRPARAWFLLGMIISAAALALHGAVTSAALLYALRFVTGVGSALTFASGGLLAARLETPRIGLVLGVYYGGTGVGIVLSALVVPLLASPPVSHGWQAAWVALGLLALAAVFVAAPLLRRVRAGPAALLAEKRMPLRPYAAGLVSYFCFGLGYIGYMTFVVSLLAEAGLHPTTIVIFYVGLGLSVIASSWLWARLLQHARGGGALALLNGLLALATLLPVVSAAPWVAFVSGFLFGSVFLAVVASTTALVRRNAEPAQWASGIAAFTSVFAFGQIVGPSLIGALSDASGGLRVGFAVSAAVLAAASLVALMQRPVAAAPPERER